jgi:hypothetical protein
MAHAVDIVPNTFFPFTFMNQLFRPILLSKTQECKLSFTLQWVGCLPSKTQPFLCFFLEQLAGIGGANGHAGPLIGISVLVHEELGVLAPGIISGHLVLL